VKEVPDPGDVAPGWATRGLIVELAETLKSAPVESPLGFTYPLRLTEVEVMFDAAAVLTPGGPDPAEVVNDRTEPNPNE
jgi:hypothetical protein